MTMDRMEKHAAITRIRARVRAFKTGRDGGANLWTGIAATCWWLGYKQWKKAQREGDSIVSVQDVPEAPPEVQDYDVWLECFTVAFEWLMGKGSQYQRQRAERLAELEKAIGTFAYNQIWAVAKKAAVEAGYVPT